MMEEATLPIENAESRGECYAVTVPVLLELIWVLRARYGFSRRDVIDGIEALSRVEGLAFDPMCDLHTFLETLKEDTLDMADALIGVHARRLGYESTVTFDRKAARTPLFETLSGD